MRYAILIYDENSATPSAEPPPAEAIKEMMDAYDVYTTLLRDRGAFQAGEALQPVRTATTVRIRDGETLTTDGPFAETKEALGGIYIIEARDLDEALEYAAHCPGARSGSVEVRPLMEVPAEYARAASRSAGPAS
jgi:hypothetical protein